MLSEKLKNLVAARSFWQAGSEKYLLPDRNLARADYLEKLDQLRNVNIITSIMGQRRCGKSVIGRQYMGKLWQEGMPRRNILYLNFFLKPLSEATSETVFLSLIDWWINCCVDREHASLLFLDEVQELENWDANVASVFEDPTLPCRIIITGSNSKMLTADFAGRLGGRITTLQVFPFSFEEFCRFENTERTTDSIHRYLSQGGMPEVLKVQEEEQRSRLISDIVNSTVKHDIISRYNPSNPDLLFSLIDYCRGNFSQELSIDSITKSVVPTVRSKKGDQSTGATTSTLVSTYINYLQDVYFLHAPPTYSHRSKDMLKRGIDKIYLSDLCMADYPAQTQQGRLLENMIFLALLKQGFYIQRYLGYRNRNLELDFFVNKNSESALIQVCWLLGDSEENAKLWEREFGNLHYTRRDIPKYVVSLDESAVSPYRDVTHINVIDFLTWLYAS